MEVWRRAHELALAVYRATDKLPKSEVFGVTVERGREVAAALADDLDPMADLRGSRATKRHLAQLLARRALAQLTAAA